MDVETIKPLNTPKLMDQIRAVLRARHYSLRTETAYLGWIKQFILYHKKRHPREMGEEEINDFLKHLAVQKNVSASTQNQALCAIVYLYKHVLNKEIGELKLIWAEKPKKLPVVFSPGEIKAVMDQLKGIYWIMAMLLYGAGLRINYPAASSGVSKRTETFGAASGGESDPSRLCQKPCSSHFYSLHYIQF